MNDINTNETEFKMPEEKFGVTATEESSEPSLSHLGIILGILIVILAMLLGGLYMWSTTLQNNTETEAKIYQRPTAEENNEPESTNAEADVQVYETTSTSDEISAIEADLESTDLDDLDAEMMAIEAELEASGQ